MFKINLKPGRYLLIVALVILGVVSIVNAGGGGSTSLSFSGEITTSDTNIQSSYFITGCTFVIFGNPIYADFQTFKVPSTGSYSFSGTSTPAGTVFMGVFHDSYSQPNCVGSNTNALTVNLTAGESYVLVVWLCHQCSTNFLGTYNINSDVPAPPPAKEPVVSAPSTDNDGDGVANGVDNCENAYNPSQEDGWGSGMGDACDTDWYNQVGLGISAFVQKNGNLNIHGNCEYLADGAPRCPVIASLDPSTFTPDAMPMDVETVNAGTWSVVLYYLNDSDGDVYQVNIYSTNPPQPGTLLDDHLEIHVHGGSYHWYQRGGDPNFGGLTN